MKQVSELRTVEVRQADGSWIRCQSMGQLEVGDVFRMFEPDGKRVVGDLEWKTEFNGADTFVCTKTTSVECDKATILDIV
jgi:hypothetical protein